MAGISLDVRAERDVVAELYLVEDAGECACGIVRVYRFASGQERNVERVVFNARGRFLEAAFRSVLRKQCFRVVFRFLYVRLIECVDAENRSGGRRRDLPEIELLADVVCVVHGQSNHGMAGSFECAQFIFGSVCRIRQIVPDVNEDAIVAVLTGITEHLALDRKNPLAAFTGRFGDELFGPRTECFDRGMRHDREFVASFDGQAADCGSKTHARRIFRRHGFIVRRHRAEAAIEQKIDVVTCNRSRHHAEEGEGGIASADVWIVEEACTEAFIFCFGFQRSSRIGDRDELPPAFLRADGFRYAIRKITVECIGLGGGATLARNDKERVRQVDRRFQIANLLRIR